MDLNNCTICPHECGVDRTVKTGVCGANEKIKVNIHQLHHWEEPVISGTQGSGTIFFSHCNLKCIFCQNFQISQQGNGQDVSVGRLADMMLELQEKNAHNINLVSPTQYTLQISKAIISAKNQGLQIPIVWNSNAYESVETLKQMEGLVDIYLPDFKYWDDEKAKKYSGISEYSVHAKKAIIEMFRQIGHLKIHEGIAFRGIMIRLLVLPENSSGLKNVLGWIHENLGEKTYISLMGQYYPTYKSSEYPELSRGITTAEYSEAAQTFGLYGFQNGFIQEVGSSSIYTPDFKNDFI
jgi:putative pyruvate formate lyase activating enzyme